MLVLIWYLVTVAGNIFPFWPLLQLNNMKNLPLKSLSWNFPTSPADLFPMTHTVAQFLCKSKEKNIWKWCLHQPRRTQNYIWTGQTLIAFVCRNNCCLTNLFCSWQFLLCYSLTRTGIASHIMIKLENTSKISSLKSKTFGKRFGQSSLTISSIPLMYN